MGLSGMAAEASDPQRMRAIIDQYLLRPGDHPVEVAACQVEFTRRGGPRSLFQYQVTLRDLTDGREWTQAVSGVAYGGEQRTRRAAERLQRHYPPGPPATGTALVRAAYVPELDLLLQVFPFDHQLPVLEPLMAGPLPGLVAPLLAQFGPGDWHFAGWEAEAVRYRVDLRACVRLTIHAREDGTGEGAERHFFAKIYASDAEAERSWSIQRDVAAALGERTEPIALAPLVAYLPDERLLVQSQVHGPSLLEVIREAASLEEAVEAVRRAARAVAALHRLPLAAPPHRLKQGRMDPERLRRRAEELRATHPDLASLVAEVEAGIRAGFATIGEAPSAPVHGDLKPNHLLFDDRIVLLDLDKFAAGDPMLDVANLLRQLRGSGSAVTQAFVEEYFAHVPAAWEHRLTPQYAWALLKEASTASKSARHESRVTPLLMGAHAVLAGGDGSSNPEPDRIPGNDERSARREERRSQCNT
jgi:hypothetical protein